MRSLITGGLAVGAAAAALLSHREADPGSSPATDFQRATLAAEGVDPTGLTEQEALELLRRLFPGWDDHET